MIKRQIPNLVSGVRVILAPWLRWAMINHYWGWAFGIAMTGAASDYLDGLIAKRLGVGTRFGKVWVDPGCDFIFALGGLSGFVEMDDDWHGRFWLATTLVTSTLWLKAIKVGFWLEPLHDFADGFLPAFYCITAICFLHFFADKALDPSLMTGINWSIMPIVGLAAYYKRDRLADWAHSLKRWWERRKAARTTHTPASE